MPDIKNNRGYYTPSHLSGIEILATFSALWQQASSGNKVVFLGL